MEPSMVWKTHSLIRKVKMMIGEDKENATILSKVAELVKTCKHFGEYDEYCNDRCILYDFCDKTYEVMRHANNR